MNLRFVARGTLLAVPVAFTALVIGFALLFVLGRLAPPPDPTPPPPTIMASRGEIPEGPIGLREWIRYVGEDYSPVGCGFIFRLDDGRVVGATVAHSHSIGDPGRPLERVALGLPDTGSFVAEFDALWGLPGRPRTGSDMRVDYILLKPDSRIDERYVLELDSRGTPQPGERVALFSGLGGGEGLHGRRMLEGTVQSVSETGFWVLMDDLFVPGAMSGSPFVSHHTGNVVGMLIAGTVRGKQLLLAANPIGNLASLAGGAGETPAIKDFVR